MTDELDELDGLLGQDVIIEQEHISRMALPSDVALALKRWREWRGCVKSKQHLMGSVYAGLYSTNVRSGPIRITTLQC